MSDSSASTPSTGNTSEGPKTEDAAVPSADELKSAVEIWKQIIGVQMHFNDIGLRVRGLFVTILVALFASIGFLLDKQLSLQIWRINIQFATLVPLFGIFGTMLFYFG